MSRLPLNFVILPEIERARRNGVPIVALESAVITHGLPHPNNLELARGVEEDIRNLHAIPATIAILDGKVRIGLTEDDLQILAAANSARKISLRDFGAAIAKKETGGTTVAATMFAAHSAGIKVFATGGIGGVHRDSVFDVSADLQALAHTPMLVVCAGAKAILDLPATMEYLETLGVPVIGYTTGELPAFYSTSSGIKLTIRADTPQDAADIARAHWDTGFCTGILVVVPPPIETAISRETVEAAVKQAVLEAEQANIRGAAITPFLLSRISEITGGKSMRSNLALLRNNARVAAEIARFLTASCNISI